MSTIAGYQAGPVNPSIVGGTGTTVKYWPNLLGPSIGVAPLTPSATNAAGQLSVPGISLLNGQFWNVKAVGNFAAGASAGSETVTIKIYAQTGQVLTSPTYTALATTTAYAPTVDGVTHSFAFDLSLYGDTTSGIVGGIYTAFIDGALNNTTPATTVNTLSGINFGNAFPFGIVAGVTFSVSNASNTASLTQLEICDF